MNVPIDACENGNAAFALRVGYDGKCYPGNLGTGGAFPGNDHSCDIGGGKR